MSTRKLLQVASESLLKAPIDTDTLTDILTPFGSIGSELLNLLGQRNGFYAFESALLLRASGQSKAPFDLASWNSKNLWLYGYSAFKISELLFFAEDVFGNQFAIDKDHVVFFDPETGETSPMADSLEGWCNAILSDFNHHTGYPLAHEWQSAHGAIERGHRLIPTIPFVAGGEYTIGNLRVVDESEGMNYRADFANQIRNLPNGARIRFRLE